MCIRYEMMMWQRWLFRKHLLSYQYETQNFKKLKSTVCLFNIAVILPPVSEIATLPPLPVNPCNPPPCGNNAQCQVVNNQAECSCLPGMIGVAPSCRPVCTQSSDCSPNQNCVNQLCVDPCPGTCGPRSICNVINHIPVCSCRPGYEGDAYRNCRPITAVVGKIASLFAFIAKHLSHRCIMWSNAKNLTADSVESAGCFQNI